MTERETKTNKNNGRQEKVFFMLEGSTRNQIGTERVKTGGRKRDLEIESERWLVYNPWA